jgi:RNA 2',3'-cyclic 3'-phosphodiesterase
MDGIRIFVAVPIPAEVRRRLGEIQARLVASGADVKWVPEANFHITMKFLGSVKPQLTGKVSSAVESAVEGVIPFDVRLSGVGAFPKPSRPSVAWVGIASGRDELKSLARNVEDALQRIGFASEAREFSPHVTLGRVRSTWHVENLRDAIDELKEEDAGSFLVESVAIMKSDLRPSGPLYTALAEFRLE